MRIRILFFLLLASSSLTFAQTGVQGGVSVIKAFGVQGVYPGIHLGIEIPRDDESSFFGRLTVTLANKVSDTVNAQALQEGTFPDVMITPVEIGSSYINIEGGNRYYLGNGYDYGWSAYGGSLFAVTLSPVRMRATDSNFDDSKYGFVDPNTFQPIPTKGSIITLNVGLNAGVKNHFAFGMLYFDVNLSYSILALPSNTFARDYSNFSPLLLGFNFGFRKDLY